MMVLAGCTLTNGGTDSDGQPKPFKLLPPKIEARQNGALRITHYAEEPTQRQFWHDYWENRPEFAETGVCGFAADSRFLVIHADDNIYLWDLSTRSVWMKVKCVGRSQSTILLSQQGKFAFIDTKGVHLYDILTKQELWVAGPGLPSTQRISFSHDGKFIAWWYDLGAPKRHYGYVDAITIFSIIDGTPTQTITLGASYFQGVSFEWSPDDSMLLAHDASAGELEFPGWATLALYRVKDGSRLREFRLSRDPNRAGFSPDGEWIFVSGGDGTEVWRVSDVNAYFKYPEIYGAQRFVQVAPNDVGLICYDGEFWDVKAPKLIRTFKYPWSPPQVFALVVSPNGKALVASTSAGLVLWDSQTGKQLFVDSESRFATSAVFSPDSRFVAYSVINGIVNIVPVPTQGK